MMLFKRTILYFLLIFLIYLDQVKANDSKISARLMHDEVIHLSNMVMWNDGYSYRFVGGIQLKHSLSTELILDTSSSGGIIKAWLTVPFLEIYDSNRNRVPVGISIRDKRNLGEVRIPPHKTITLPLDMRHYSVKFHSPGKYELILKFSANDLFGNSHDIESESFFFEVKE